MMRIGKRSFLAFVLTLLLSAVLAIPLAQAAPLEDENFIADVEELGSVPFGQPCSISGTIQAKSCFIQEVKGEILCGGEVVQSAVVDVYTQSFSLQGSAIDNNLFFGQLASGDYSLRISAEDEDFNSIVTEQNFQVRDPEYVILNVEQMDMLEFGQPQSISGTIQADTYFIQEVKGEILCGNEVLQSAVVDVYTQSFQLQGSAIDNNLFFGQLAVGSYTLRISAEDDMGNAKSIQQQFRIYIPGVSALALDVDPIPQRIIYRRAQNICGTISSDYAITSAYAQILAGNTVLQSVELEPGCNSLDIASSQVNTGLRFAQLPEGDYSLLIAAVDETGKSLQSLQQFSIYIPRESGLAIELADIPAITQNGRCSINGSAISAEKIDSLCFEVFNGNTRMRLREVYPFANAVFIDSQSMEDFVLINTLPVGDYVLRVSASDVSGNYVFVDKPFSVAMLPSQLAIEQGELGESGIVPKSTNVWIEGSLSSNYKIERVYVELLKNGNMQQAKEVYPNAYEYELGNASINDAFHFAWLPLGNYTLRVSATDASGLKLVSQQDFQVGTPASKLSIQLENIGVHGKGQKYTVTGTVSSNYNLSSVTGEILKSGSSLQWRSATVSGTEHAIQSGNLQYLSFDKLAVGNYVLRVSAKDQSGKSVVVNQPFSVAITPTELAINAEPMGTVVKGSDPTISGSISSNFKLSNVKVELLSGKTVKQSKSINPSAYSYELSNSTLNNAINFATLAAGNYSLRISATDSTGYALISEEAFVVEAVPSTLAIQIDELGVIAKKSDPTITGLISSNYKLKNYKVELLSGKTVKQSRNISASSYSIDLSNSTINNAINFATLAAGDYILRITATDAENTVVVAKQNFSIEVVPSTLAINAAQIGDFARGCDPLISGIVSSNYKLSNVKVELLFGKTVKQSKSINPSAYSYDLSNSSLNSAINFSTLIAGDYSLRISATDSEGTKVVSEQSFTVYKPTPIYSNPELRQGSKGYYVQLAQQKLNEKNNAGLVVDGDFGYATSNAVKRFQSKVGLKADGYIGAETWAYLLA